MNFGAPLTRVRRAAPLVQCITNFVTVNDCANIILAAGGSPTMAEDIREAAESAAAASALVCNFGAVEKVPAMIDAGRQANQRGIPVVLDPVAAGGTAFRRAEIARLLGAVRFSVIRGNASEIRALASGTCGGSGVDVSLEDLVTEDSLPANAALAQTLSRRTGAVVAISGPIDILSDGSRTLFLRNGCATMARITGSGCMLAALLGAFCGAAPDDIFPAVCGGVAAMDIAGELAERRRLQNGTGNATFRTDLIDAVFNLTEQQINEGVHDEVYKG